MNAKNINHRLVIEACLQGHSLSQQKLYEWHYGYGIKIALRYVKSYAQAEEILNDAFLKVFNHLDKYDTQYPFRSWLRKIITNAAIDYLRKYEKRKIVFSAAVLPDLGIEEPSRSSLTEEDEELNIVKQLSPAYRLVFNLYVMEGYKHHEIAEKLNISVGASKSNLARAKVRLKKLWALNNRKMAVGL